MWSTAQRLKKIYGHDANVKFDLNNRSVDYGKQCALARSCDEDGGWSCNEGECSCFEKCIIMS